MAEPRILIEQPPLAQTPLLEPIQNHTKSPLSSPHPGGVGGGGVRHVRADKDNLEKSLRKLERFLWFLGFNQASVLSFSLSWIAFVAIGVVLPVLVLELCNGLGCDKYQIENFELDIVASQACLAVVSLICMSHNLRKYGIRKFLFVDRLGGQSARLRGRYIQQISNSVRLLVFCSLPCFILKTAREVTRSLYVRHESWWLSIIILFALILSWSYSSTITLSASILFHLVCNLQVIHFEEYAKLLETESDVSVFIEEHIRLRYHLSKISHRFRIFLLLQFLIVTASQFVTLFRTTSYMGTITFINGGDFAVSAIVQVVGITFCLHAATKISHRAQAIASVASRWHAMATCSSTDSTHMRFSPSTGNLEAIINPLNSLRINYSESDLESMDYMEIPTNTRLVSYMSSYHKRQAFVMYLQTNPGGITIFGWIVDRAFLNTIFFIELSLVTFVLGKTIINS